MVLPLYLKDQQDVFILNTKLKVLFSCYNGGYIAKTQPGGVETELRGEEALTP